MSQSILPRRDVGPADDPAPRSDGLPRFVAVVCALVTFAAVAVSSLLAVTIAFEFSSQLSAVMPLLLIVAAVGVGRLWAWGPRGLPHWRGRLGYLTAAPYVVLMCARAVYPTLLLPAWVAPAVGFVAAWPFVWAAMRRAAPALVLWPSSDQRGRSGALYASVALVVLAFAVVRPDLGVFLQVLLAVALVLVAFTARGLADAGATWSRAQWVALVWGCLTVWAGVPIQGMTRIFVAWWGPVPFVLAAGLPLALVSRRR